MGDFIYLTGCVRPELFGLRDNLGFMLTPDIRTFPDTITYVPEKVQFFKDQMWWAADTGCYSGKKYTLKGYLKWLETWRPVHERCLFANAPDVVGNAQMTWGRSMDVLPLIREMGYKAGYVAQDGIWDMDIQWDAFDVLFVGGTTEFKLHERTYELVAEAKRRGKKTHMGRVNSWDRIRAAITGGYDSADGTYICFAPDINIPKTAKWCDFGRTQPLLFDMTVQNQHDVEVA
jgi:hypothetical protein